MELVDRIADVWGPRTPYGRGETWPRRVDAYLADDVTRDDVDAWVPAASVLHSNGDAMDIAVRAGRIVGVRGRARDRINHGRLDPKDLYAWQANNSPDRLRTPLVRRRGRLVEASWDEAMDAVVAATGRVLAEQGPAGIGFYTSGQLFLEEYYTLGVVARGGIGTNHTDGNTRLCTATAAEALKLSFGCDGQPGTYTDVDHTDVIALYGHNVAETQTVLWMRILDRLGGSDPPRLLCIDPRTTEVARAAAVHLAPRPGTNLALMNAFLHQLIARGRLDEAYIAAHTVGFDSLAATVEPCTPRWAAGICDVREADIEAAAELIGTAPRLLSTVLQGFYQSHQATAASVAVNNVHLLRGMLGRPGCGVLQMNGQPTAQNTRECGADGDIAGFRNWANPGHVAELARLWGVPQEKLTHDKPPTSVLEQLQLIAEGSLRLWWVQATNPVVSLPELARVRDLLRRPFLVVQDIFHTETAALADVVLPAATWGEKEGAFTNADRTVHYCGKAVEPPGDARSDLDILCDFARRMDLRTSSGDPLVGWTDPAGAFAAWRECSRGRPCDYTGLSYALLREGGVQWPCEPGRTAGTERLYADGRFPTGADECETYGKDLISGEPVQGEAYRAADPGGRAFLRSAPYVPPPEQADAQLPLLLTTGRTVYHFHTRTKTARAPQLQNAAPDVWVELSARDAQRLGAGEGEPLEVATRRGVVHARLRVGGIREGVAFLPFHYGYWDVEDPAEHDRAANELTRTEWDPCSKQPTFKISAARVRVVSGVQAPPGPLAPAEPADPPVPPEPPAPAAPRRPSPRGGR